MMFLLTVLVCRQAHLTPTFSPLKAMGFTQVQDALKFPRPLDGGGFGVGVTLDIEGSFIASFR
jgi:hypothetical protein